MEHIVIVLGSDQRNPHLVNKLQSEAWDAQLFVGEDVSNEAIPLSCCRAAILPVNHPGEGRIEGTSLTVEEAAEGLSAGAMMFAGRLSENNKNVLGNKGCTYVEFAQDPGFIIRNAYLTAEAAVAQAVLHSRGSLMGAVCTILGSGRIADALIRFLSPYTNLIRIVARRESERARLSLIGCSAYGMDEISWAMFGADYIFNTIPFPVIKREHLRELSQDYLYLELASPPYGFDPDLEWPEGGTHLIAGGLPGKVSPKAAGTAAAEYVLKHLRG